MVPSDEVYEKGVSCATKVYQFVMEGELGKFVAIHEDSAQQLKIAMLDTKKVNKTLQRKQYMYMYTLWYCSHNNWVIQTL